MELKTNEYTEDIKYPFGCFGKLELKMKHKIDQILKNVMKEKCHDDKYVLRLI